MLWQGRRQSGNVEDRRGSGGGIAVGGGIGGIIIAIIYFFLSGGEGGDVLQQQQTQPVTQEEKAAQDQLAGFTRVVLADTEDVWNKLFSGQGKDYIEPKLVLFTGSDQSGCGFANAATGPFYCPADSKIYIDLSFFQELKGRFGAPGDFAMAYVIAHEVGHHVQHLLGITGEVDQMRGRLSETEMNRLSVRLELQADFLAGVWAHHAQKMKQMLEQGDIEEALGAANAIGDDRLQKQSQGYVVPDAFTHGTSAQRMYWFKKGFETGDLKQGDTFNSEI
ncbi:MAG TPA: neutral zinc metallopeptidase [Chitinophagaceae bacterium]